MISKPSISAPFLHRLNWGKFEAQGVSISVWREDLNHPDVSGNKWYKVGYHLQRARELGFSQVASMGGPWSNHLHALAAATHDTEIRAIGLVRGSELRFLSPMLEDALSWEMDLRFIDFPTYRQLRTEGQKHALIQSMGAEVYFIPEGGSGPEVIHAFKPLVKDIERHIVADYCMCATGTGGTLAGLIHNADPKTCIIGVQAVAEGEATADRIRSWLPSKVDQASWTMWNQSHRGGFGKIDPELRVFMAAIRQRFNLDLDPVYTGKALLAAHDALEGGVFSVGDEVVLIHTGGLQGARGAGYVSSEEFESDEAKGWIRSWNL